MITRNWSTTTQSQERFLMKRRLGKSRSGRSVLTNFVCRDGMFSRTIHAICAPFDHEEKMSVGKRYNFLLPLPSSGDLAGMILVHQTRKTDQQLAKTGRREHKSRGKASCLARSTEVWLKNEQIFML
jgi:hypothetical protein